MEDLDQHKDALSLFLTGWKHPRTGKDVTKTVALYIFEYLFRKLDTWQEFKKVQLALTPHYEKVSGLKNMISGVVAVGGWLEAALDQFYTAPEQAKLTRLKLLPQRRGNGQRTKTIALRLTPYIPETSATPLRGLPVGQNKPVTKRHASLRKPLIDSIVGALTERPTSILNLWGPDGAGKFVTVHGVRQ